MDEGSKLFREEFTRSASNNYGSVSVPAQRAVWAAALSFALGFLALGLVLHFLTYTRSESARGYLVIDSSRTAISSLFVRPAEVTAVFVRAGQRVVPGAPVAALRGTDLSISHDLQGVSNSFPSYGSDPLGSTTMPRVATLLSTQTGYVESVLVRSGEHVDTGQPLVVMTSSPDHMKVAVLLSSRAVGQVERMMDVQIRLDSYPFQRFGTIKGRVSAVSNGSLSPSEISRMFGIIAPSENMFIVDVELVDTRVDALKLSLRPGMTATIDFPVEERRMLQWVFAPRNRRS